MLDNEVYQSKDFLTWYILLKYDINFFDTYLIYICQNLFQNQLNSKLLEKVFAVEQNGKVKNGLWIKVQKRDKFALMLVEPAKVVWRLICHLLIPVSKTKKTFRKVSKTKAIYIRLADVMCSLLVVI